MKAAYLETIELIERLHQLFLKTIEIQLRALGMHDINSVQSLILYTIGDAEMTAADLDSRGSYFGWNVLYNVKKMIKSGYLVQESSIHNRRLIHFRLSEKGKTLDGELDKMYARHISMLNEFSLSPEDLQTVSAALKQLERSWTRSDPPQRHMVPGKAALRGAGTGCTRRSSLSTAPRAAIRGPTKCGSFFTPAPTG
jgi:DNA-binding MarR family transcriptional regulator